MSLRTEGLASYQKLLITAIASIVVAPVLWSLGGAAGTQPVVHWLDTCLYAWSLALYITAAICGIGSLFTWGEDD